jgi:LysR family glycine cleavage system transcriptional activator
MPAPLSLDDLHAFDLLAQTLSFRAAAARAHLSAPAFSDRVSRLEGELGVRLFERTTRRVSLTPAGARLLPHARRCLAEAAALRVAASEQVAAWQLTLGTRYELGLSWLTPALDRLRAAHPERTIHLHVGDGPDLLDAVRRGRIDAMVTSLRLDPNEVVSVPVHPERYVFVAAPELLAAAPFWSLADAPAHTLCDSAPDLPLFRYLLERLGGPAWPFARHEILGGIGAVRFRVVRGAGVAVLPRYLVEPDLEAGRLVVLLPDTPPLPDTFRLSWRPGHPRGDDLLTLAEELRQIPLA